MKALRDVFGDTLVALGWTIPMSSSWTPIWPIPRRRINSQSLIRTGFCRWASPSKNFVGVAVGLASLGFVPWLSTFTVFFTHRAIDPIRMLVAQTHANVKIGAAYSGILTGLTGKTHQDVQDLAIMRAMPDMTVLAPADAIEGKRSFAGQRTSRARSTCVWRATHRQISSMNPIASCPERRFPCGRAATYC